MERLIVEMIEIPSTLVENECFLQMSRDTRFPTMWYVRPAKPQISLRIRAV